MARDRELDKLADEKLGDRFDYELERRYGPDFIEIVGSIGGDVLTYRVYKDGSVYER